MTIPFSGIITPSSVAFTLPNGRMQNVTSAHHNYTQLCATVKELQTALRAGDVALASDLHQTLATLSEPAKMLVMASNGKVTVRDGVVYYGDEAINNGVTERILWGLGEGYDMGPYIKFLENLMANPSKRAVTELYEFLEKHKMGISDDGQIVAYKKIRGDYKDIYTGKFDNSPGQILEMPRNKVDDEASRTCSTGFHFCAFDYLGHYGTGPGNKVVIVKVNPADVVSIPADYDAAKARACRYEVIGEYTGADLQDILSTKAVWSSKDWSNDDSFHDVEDADLDDDLGDDLFDDESDDEWLEADDSVADDADVVIEDLSITGTFYTYGVDGAVETIEVEYEDGTVTYAETDDEIRRVEEKLAEQRKAAEILSLPIPEPVVRSVDIESVRFDTPNGNVTVEVTYVDGVVTVATDPADIDAISAKLRDRASR